MKPLITAPLILLILFSSPVHAETPGETVDVSKVTEKYWAEGKDTELGVVQNRRYTNEGKMTLGLLAGSLSYDPFQKVSSYSVSLGYHLNPYLSLHGFFSKWSVSDSPAYQSLKAEAPLSDLYRNSPRSSFGVEAHENLLYGKASLLGKAIIYVDLFLLAGIGVTQADSGNSFTPLVGFGQTIHINKSWALHFDYRIQSFSETVKNTLQMTRTRRNTSDGINFGLQFQY